MGFATRKDGGEEARGGLLINLLQTTDKNNFPCRHKFKVILLSNAFWIKKHCKDFQTKI
jgi:hypothetical protein